MIEQEQRAFLKKYRDMTVTYIWGDSRVGKSKYVNLKYDYEVYSIGNYDRGMWDMYNGEKVVLFEEFHSDIKINDMLRWLDGNPVRLPARYKDKIACFDKVYITSNEPLSKQYPNIQNEKPKTYEAFLNRIDYIWEMGKTDKPVSTAKVNGKLTAEQITAFGAVDDIF
ncbi:MAG: RNA helicase domain-containing protein [Firmicutes bacterium]|nr:RNA helicase domain-containing protein [Bacillota bacterium]